jgi:hypothetical protein
VYHSFSDLNLWLAEKAFRSVISHTILLLLLCNGLKIYFAPYSYVFHTESVVNSSGGSVTIEQFVAASCENDFLLNNLVFSGHIVMAENLDYREQFSCASHFNSM